MPSAFEEVARNALQELDCGELVPVGSLCQAAGFQPYSLLARKTCGSLFWKTRYKCVDLTLRDLLEPDAPEPDTVQDGPFHLHDAIDGKLKGSGELTSPAVQGRLSLLLARGCARQRPQASTPRARAHRRLRQPEPKILQQLRRRGDNLYVVTKVLRTLGEAKVTRTLKQEGSGQMALLSAVCLKGKGEGHLSREQTVTIPEGSVLAFQPALLTIDSNWEVLLFPDKKQKTFGPPKQGFLQRAGLGLFPASGDSVQSDAAAQSYTLAEDWQGLQAEVAEQQGLCVLSGQLCEQLLHGLAELLPGEAALQRLEESVSRGTARRPAPRRRPAGAG
ncbi:PREDICTED: gasdermin-D [Condylura cristata]|uniref:gasdermin-D n=1 Tax=Condylura cristata TaxID=143302 RepID=UPI000643349E|nr:PREDICTED: gasdermin-D [Condylura cristata]